MDIDNPWFPSQAFTEIKLNTDWRLVLYLRTISSMWRNITLWWVGYNINSQESVYLMNSSYIYSKVNFILNMIFQYISKSFDLLTLIRKHF